MYKIAVLGERDSIYGFASVGLDIYPVDDVARAPRQLKNLVENDYAIIYVTEALYAQIETDINAYRAEALPAIIAIPGATGNTGRGIAAVKKSVEQAVGSDILFGGEG